MLEKRQAVRYRVGEATDIVIFRDAGNLVAPLVDLSVSGLMTAMPESECRRLLPGREICGQLRRCNCATGWRGRVVHRSRVRCGIGIGIAFTEGADSPLFDAVRDMVRQPDAGGLHLKREADGLILEVHGRLSFLTSRDSLAYIQRNSIASIDLAHCCSVDSAGLGMLCVAREQGIAIVGAQGAVKKLLAIVRIAPPAKPH